MPNEPSDWTSVHMVSLGKLPPAPGMARLKCIPAEETRGKEWAFTKGFLCAEAFTNAALSLLHHPSEQAHQCIQFLQRGILRLRKVKQLDQEHTAIRWQSWVQTPGLSDPEVCVLPSHDVCY